MRSVSTRGHRYLIKRGQICLTIVLVGMASLAAIPSATAQAGATTPATTTVGARTLGAATSNKFVSPAVIVVGFVGGFVHPDDERHLEVRMIERIAQDSPGVRAVVFDNRHTTRARDQILHWLDADGNGRLSDREKRGAQIILLGHSWGGAAAIRLANELNQSDVPVLLTIQLDSVNKGPGNDCVIPPNVAQVLNFYQTRGLVHGCRTPRPVDASRTKILGNFAFEYAAQPTGCSSYSWFNRHVLKTHNAMDCDPQVWSLVEREIRNQVQNVVGSNKNLAGNQGS